MEMNASGKIDIIEKNRLQYFYDRFFMNRIGIRTLIYQHSRSIDCLCEKGNFFF